MADNVPKFPSLDDLFTQVVPLQFQFLPQLVYLHERSTITYCHGCVRGKVGQPLERALVWMHSQKDCQSSNNASAKVQGMTNHAFNLFRFRPLTINRGILIRS